MILLWFILGVLLAFAIARYNESNKLFWQLMLAFVLAYAATVMCTRTFQKEQSSEILTKVYPTQMSNTSVAVLKLFQTDVVSKSTKVTGSNSVSQVITPEINKNIAILDGVFGRTRDQPISIIEEPPELDVEYYNTS